MVVEVFDDKKNNICKIMIGNTTSSNSRFFVNVGLRGRKVNNSSRSLRRRGSLSLLHPIDNMALLLLLLCYYLLLMLLLPSTTRADLVLSEKIVNLAMTSAALSSLAYNEDPQPTNEQGDTIYDTFRFFDEEPDQAIVASKDGYCFVAFRGTTLTWIDWQQNFELGKQDICVNVESDKGQEKEEDETAEDDDGDRETCCSTRIGFYKAYMTTYKDELEHAIRTCAKTICLNSRPDECVVFTGHSQGGAIAAVAGLILADLNPYVITFGQPATIDAPCDLVTSERWYRFINTKPSIDTGVGITYDPVPFVPGLGAASFGHMILLGDDPTGVAYVGLDSQDVFGPLNTLGFEAHSMIHGDGVPYLGYTDKLKLILNTTNYTYPLRVNGYQAGSLCSQSIECQSNRCERETTFSFARCVGVECTTDEECDTKRCDSGLCIPKLGSCMPCNENSDCEGDNSQCILFHCSNRDGFMDDECICKWDSDCDSGRCELFESGTCEAQLNIGSRCNEDSDCLSGVCNWKFRCDYDKATKRANKKKKKQQQQSQRSSGSNGRSSTSRAGGGSGAGSGNNGSSIGGKKLTWLGIFFIIILVCIGIIHGLRWYLRRRQGYESVTEELVV